jgi:glutamine phosphoribosylpyrophosphate amidotransferase
LDFQAGEILTTVRGFGELPQSTIDGIADRYNNPGRYYYIVHSQAPTTESRDISNVHPAKMFDRTGNMSLLWHNGIIKDIAVKQLQAELNNSSTWDTELLMHYITTGTGNLSNIDGSFACLMYHNKSLYMFRNEISPLFIDFDMNISSTKFEIEVTGSFPVIHNRMYKLDLKNNKSTIESTFLTKNSPYLMDME